MTPELLGIKPDAASFPRFVKFQPLETDCAVAPFFFQPLETSKGAGFRRAAEDGKSVTARERKERKSSRHWENNVGQASSLSSTQRADNRKQTNARAITPAKARSTFYKVEPAFRRRALRYGGRVRLLFPVSGIGIHRHQKHKKAQKESVPVFVYFCVFCGQLPFSQPPRVSL
jgi:hypothetical protein